MKSKHRGTSGSASLLVIDIQPFVQCTAKSPLGEIPVIDVIDRSSMPTGWPFAESPFHPAELALQERFGRRARLDSGARRGINNYLIEQHREFFAQLPYVLVASIDESGQPWASMITGNPGFASSPDPHHLHFDMVPMASDPLSHNLVQGAPIGVLGIELATRRRNRANGTIDETGPHGFSMQVSQSYGNCPQYIQTRELVYPPSNQRANDPNITLRKALTDADRTLLTNAGTFFVATANTRPDAGAARGADISHRGGRPGFIRIDDDRTITTPDFIGNFFFNTLGNITVESRAGLLFADFATGDILLAAARAEIVWNGPEVSAFTGAQRLVRFHLTQLIRLGEALPFRGATPGYARELARTGTWAEATTLSQ